MKKIELKKPSDWMGAACSFNSLFLKALPPQRSAFAAGL